MARRATLFIDGNNWYHGLKGLGSVDLGRLDYRRLSLKLVGPRQWIGTRYYIGRVPQSGDVKLYTGQRRFLAKLESEPRISTHLGRLEPRPAINPTARDLRSYLSNLRTKIDFRVFQDLMRLARRQQKTTVFVEKAVDVMLAVDLVVMAERDDFDDAYLLSADGDFTPAVEHVRSRGKRVYAVSAASGARLAAAVNSFIRIRGASWFDDCHDVSDVARGADDARRES